MSPADAREALDDVVGIIGEGHRALVDGHAKTLAGYRRMVDVALDLARLVAPPDQRDGSPPYVAALVGLEDRDIEIVQALADGYSVKQLARRMAVSERTIRDRISRVREVTGAGSMFELGIAVAERGWLRTGEPSSAADAPH